MQYSLHSKHVEDFRGFVDFCSAELNLLTFITIKELFWLDFCLKVCFCYSAATFNESRLCFHVLRGPTMYTMMPQENG